MLVGLSGYAGSGKDEAAWALCEYAGFERVAFADKLKALIYEYDDRVRNLVDHLGWDGAKKTPAVRTSLQVLGVAVRTHLGEDTWVTAALADLAPGVSYVCTDVRFPNEAAAIKARGGMMIRIERPRVRPINGHISETALNNWDFDDYIDNDEGVDKLHGAILHIVA